MFHEDDNQPDISAERRRAWTERLYFEHENIAWQFKVSLRRPVIEVTSMKSKWGSWDEFTRTLSIARELIELHSWDCVLEILKHEMAHQLVSEGSPQRARVETSHGLAFKEACARLGVADWAVRASGALPESIPNRASRDVALSDEEQRLVRRAEKLLSLANSSNENEALLAMQRVRELYARFNLERLAARHKSAMEYILISRRRKRVSQTESMIFSILAEHFFVRVIYGDLYDAKDACSYKTAELLGTRENVLMAEYVYHFLWQKIHVLWEDYRRLAAKAQRAKSSYQLGVLAGFRDKLAKSRPQEKDLSTTITDPKEQKALLALGDRQLEAYVGSRHPRLSRRSWSRGYRDPGSFSAGVAAGGRLTLSKGLTRSDGNRGLLLR